MKLSEDIYKSTLPGVKKLFRIKGNNIVFNVISLEDENF